MKCKTCTSPLKKIYYEYAGHRYCRKCWRQKFHPDYVELRASSGKCDYEKGGWCHAPTPCEELKPDGRCGRGAEEAIHKNRRLSREKYEQKKHELPAIVERLNEIRKERSKR